MKINIEPQITTQMSDRVIIYILQSVHMHYAYGYLWFCTGYIRAFQQFSIYHYYHFIISKFEWMHYITSSLNLYRMLANCHKNQQQWGQDLLCEFHNNRNDSYTEVILPPHIWCFASWGDKMAQWRGGVEGKSWLGGPVRCRKCLKRHFEAWGKGMNIYSGGRFCGLQYLVLCKLKTSFLNQLFQMFSEHEPKFFDYL